MAGWHHRLDGHEFEQAPGVGDGQGSLTCCSPWGRRVRCKLVTEQQHMTNIVGEEFKQRTSRNGSDVWYLET